MTDRFLVIDDDPDTCELLTMALEQHGAKVTATTSAREGLDHLSRELFDVVLTDIAMTEMNGLEVCERVAGIQPSTPVIVVTGQSNLDTSIGAMRAGAFDFITKPVDVKLLAIRVARAVHHKRLHDELKTLREVVAATNEPTNIVGSSNAIRKVHDTIARIATSDASVLIAGETGSGKELVARRIHATSSRREGPFVSINCAAVPHTLLESELFGHARGAFTDAKADRAGLFVQANGGTLFLDEIGELPLEMQPKLLRALQDRKVRPVGANTEVPFDARLIVASNRDLDEEVDERRFRPDLYYRINVVRVDLPPLRERAADVLELAQHFLTRASDRGGRAKLTLSPAAAEKLIAYQWPGNVRELENCIERAMAFARFDQITVEDLPEKLRAYRGESFVVAADDSTEIVTLDELERRYVVRVLSILAGNKSRAAQVLGIDRRTLYRKIDKWSGTTSVQGSSESVVEP
jgi:two-component system, NtrC family, response regulator HydG